MGVATVRSPGEALADKSFLADGCVVEMEDPGSRARSGMPARSSSSRRRREGSAGPAPAIGRAHRRGARRGRSDARGTIRRQRRRQLAGTAPAHPLPGVRVLDLGLGVAGPFTGRVLADLGADVIKVNALHDTYWNGTHMGLGTNRGKRSIALNLKDEAGQGGPREAARDGRRAHAELATGRCGPPRNRLRDPPGALSRDWSTATPGGTRRGRARTCPAPTRLPRP